MATIRRLPLAVVAALVLLTPAACGAWPQGDSYSGRGFAPIPGGRLLYEVRGRGETVVLIHGGQLDSRMWDAQFETYARQYRVVRYDIRGFGGSTPAESPYSNAGDLAALMDYLGIRWAHIVGLSLGGMVATDFAVTYPDRVASLVLSGPGITGIDNESAEEVARYYAEIRAARDHGPDSLVKLWLSDPLMAPAAEHPRLRALLERISYENVHAWTSNYLLQRIPRPPTAQRLADIKAPTLVLVGSLDVPSIHDVVDTVVKTVPGARKVVIPGAGHMAPLEKPAEFDRAVLGFLHDVTMRGGARERP